MKIDGATGMATAIAVRHAELATVLSRLSIEDLAGPSRLPGWSRLTIVCHLRYGAEASKAVTLDAVAGREAAFYPEGRAQQRPATLVPRRGERPADVVDSFVDTSTELDGLWGTLGPAQWELEMREPVDNPDLGSTTLGLFALLRLTEVEVHGLDLNVGAQAWSDVFVEAALPTRLRWLPARRSNHSPADEDVEGTWILRPTDGMPPFAVRASRDGVMIEEDTRATGDAELGGPSRDLLASLLGRLPLEKLAVTGDVSLAASFHRAFPAP